jgi:RimJ/RimL family protein N-acetyltransferase
MLIFHEQPSDDHIVATRIELTPITPADAADMVEVLSGAEPYTFIGGSAPSLNELRERYIRLAVGRPPDGQQEWYNWVIRYRFDGQAMGTVQATVFDDEQRAKIAWIVGLRWQRQRYATEAAQALVDWLDNRGVPYITAHVHPKEP